MKALRDLRAMVSKHPWISDGAFMLLVAGSAFFVQRVYCVVQPPPLNAPVTITLALLAIVPSTWRPLLIVSTLVLVTATLVASGVIDVIVGVNLASIASTMAVFSSAAYGGHRRNLACAGSTVAFNGGLMYNLVFGSNVVFLSGAGLLNVAGLLWNLTAFLATWWFGNSLRTSRERTSPLNASMELLVRKSGSGEHRVVLGGCLRTGQALHRSSARFGMVMRMRGGAAWEVLARSARRWQAWLSPIETSVRRAAAQLHRLPSLVHDQRQDESSSTKAAEKSAA